MKKSCPCQSIPVKSGRGAPLLKEYAYSNVRNQESPKKKNQVNMTPPKETKEIPIIAPREIEIYEITENSE